MERRSNRVPDLARMVRRVEAERWARYAVNKTPEQWEAEQCVAK